MRIYPLPLILIAFSFFVSAHGQANIRVGDDLESTLERLGKPIGSTELRDKTLLLYPHGEVEIREDRVVDFDLMTVEAFAEYQAQLDQERKEWAAEQERRERAHAEEGRSVKEAKMSSSAFAARPAKDRVDYWRSFQIRYPSVDVSGELARALEGYETELAELKAQQRIADLETRVARAEKEAAQARLETKRLREEAQRQRQSNRYGLRYYYDGPAHQPRHVYRPPTVTILTNHTGSRVIQTNRSTIKKRH
jgi:hypothetical protein